MEHMPDRVGAHSRQAVRGTTQGALERAQRPGGCAVLLQVRCASHFRQDPFSLHGRVGGRRTASMARLQGSQAFAVEATHPARDGISALASGGLCGVRVGNPLGHREQRSGPSHVGCGFGLRTADLFQPLPLLFRERTQGIDFAARHWHLRACCLQLVGLDFYGLNRAS